MKISSVMKPNMWALIRLLKDEESLTTYKIANALGCHPVKDDNPGRTKKRLARAEMLHKIVLTWAPKAQILILKFSPLTSIVTKS